MERVREVYGLTPPAGKTATGKIEGPKENEDPAAFWRKKAEEEIAQADYAEARRRREAVELGEKPESPFKIHGEVDLGRISPADTINTLQQEIRAREATAMKRQEELEQQRDSFRDSAMQAHISVLQAENKANIDRLQSILEASMASRSKEKSLEEQISSIKALAGALGYVTPSSMPQTPGEVTLQLEMLKLQNDASREQREFELRMKESDRNFQMQLQEAETRRQLEMAKINDNRERTKMFGQFPEMIGGAVARGLMNQANNPSSPPQSHSGPSIGAPAAQPESYIEALPGEAGVLECPKCGKEMAFGPTARAGVCASCNLRIPIRRVNPPPQEQAAPQGKPPQSRPMLPDDMPATPGEE